VLRRLDPSAPPVADAFGAHGDDVLFNSAPAVADPARLLPFRHAFLGSCVRPERADRATRRWLESDEPFTYVSFGTFLSRREDVLADVAATLRRRGGRVALATGSARLGALGPLPASWHVAPTLPQVTLLTRAAAAITHGGNNTVTECLAAGVPMVVLPFSTDQFAIAADLERVDAATALDPNATPHDALDLALDGTGGARRRSLVGLIAEQLRAPSGPAIALERLRPVPTERAP
jgi:UDP:flavonoid glycosyltransferase YjiC (YdhE family)